MKGFVADNLPWGKFCRVENHVKRYEECREFAGSSFSARYF